MIRVKCRLQKLQDLGAILTPIIKDYGDMQKSNEVVN